MRISKRTAAEAAADAVPIQPPDKVIRIQGERVVRRSGLSQKHTSGYTFEEKNSPRAVVSTIPDLQGTLGPLP